MADLFADWSPAERWFAGLLWADGHLLPASRNAIVLNLTDEDAITAAAEMVGRGYSTTMQPPTAARTPRKPLHRLYFSNPEIVKPLVAAGFGPKPGRLWPEGLASGAFMRGLFDGDGSVFWHFDDRYGGGRWFLRSSMSGPSQLLAGMQDWLAGQGVSPKTIAKRYGGGGSGWGVSWGQRDSMKLGEIMYAEPGPHIARKRARFRSKDAP